MRRVLVSALAGTLVWLVACGGGSGPTSPSAPIVPTFPSVAGNYSGSMTITFLTLGGTATCPVSTSITQSGASVTIGTVTPSGSCANLAALPSLGTFTETTGGSLGSTTQNNVPGGSCNGTYTVTFSAGFSGSAFQFSFAFNGATGGCATTPGNFTVSGTLTKQ